MGMEGFAGSWDFKEEGLWGLGFSGNSVFSRSRVCWEWSLQLSFWCSCEGWGITDRAS